MNIKFCRPGKASYKGRTRSTSRNHGFGRGLIPNNYCTLTSFTVHQCFQPKAYMIIVLHKSGATPKGKDFGENKGWQGKDSPEIQCPQVSHTRSTPNPEQCEQEFRTFYVHVILVYQYGGVIVFGILPESINPLSCWSSFKLKIVSSSFHKCLFAQMAKNLINCTTS